MSYSVVRDLVVDDRDVRLYSSGVGRPVVMLHALAGTAASFESLVPAWITAEREVVALDLPGHGHSHPIRGTQLSAFADAVAETLPFVTDEPVDLLGHDLGGYVALSIAARRPELVRRLVLEEPAIPPRSGRGGGSIVPVSMKVRGAVNVMRQGIHGLSRVRTVVDQLRDADPQWWESLGRIDCPVLIVDGGSGQAHNGADLTALAAAIPGAQRKSLAVGHRAHSVAPAEFARTVMPFLTD